MDKYEQLEKIADLKSKGVLTDEEYEAEKQKLLSGNHLSSAEQTEAINDYWRQQFAEIESKGIINYKKFNWPACLFTFFWAFGKGMWENALATIGIITAATVIDLVFDSPATSRALMIGLNIGLAVFYGQSANKWYYRKAVKKETIIY